MDDDFEARLALVEDDLLVATRLSTQLQSKITELRDAIAELQPQWASLREGGDSAEKRAITQKNDELKAKLKADIERVAGEELLVQQAEVECEELSLKVLTRQKILDEMNSELLALDRQIELVDGASTDDLSELQSTYFQLTAELGQLQQILALKKKELKEKRNRVTLKTTPSPPRQADIEKEIEVEESRKRALLIEIADAKEKMKSLLGQRDDGSGTGSFAQEIVLAELYSQQPASDSDDEDGDEGSELCLFEESARDFEQIQNARLEELRSQLSVVQERAYLQMLQREKADLEYEYYSNV
jgi:hypothetical protein